MARVEKIGNLARAALVPGLALSLLLAIAAYAILGPTGLLAWGDYEKALDNRETQIAMLTEQRDALENRVELLDRNGADADLIGELLRKELNVVHPDEIVVPLK